ncbi:MAG: TIGR03089 family protein [Propioniciclava sp.]
MAADLPSTALVRAARSRGGAPLLTHYGSEGSRTELSLTSFANWVDKTANLLDDFGVGAPDRVMLPVLTEHPGHWMALLWPFALWRVGAAADLTGEPLPRAEVAVVGPSSTQALAPHTLVCSLDPWARPMTGLPSGLLDFAAEALAQPDTFGGASGSAHDLAWVDPERSLTQADLAEISHLSNRLAATPATPWQAIEWLVGAILGGGSLVLVDSGVADITRIVSTEKAHLA